MSRPSLRRIKQYALQRLGLKGYLRNCGDGRSQPRRSAHQMLWSLLAGQLLRETSFHAIEAVVRSGVTRQLGVNTCFGDDSLGYFTERLDVAPTRAALADVVRRAKRNKAFQDSALVGLAIDGTTVGRCRESGCDWCRPYRNQKQQVIGYRHHLAMVSVVSGGLSLPVDVEPYGPNDSEYAAGQRLLRRSVSAVGIRFADYVVVDAEYASSTFLHLATEIGIPVVARLKANLPELSQAVEKSFGGKRPHRVVNDGADRIELWDAADFDPWETLDWESVRVLRYRQHKPDGTVVQADWLTNLPSRVLSLPLYRIAKSRWQIENEGFNDCKSRQGFEHICHHERNSLLVIWLLTLLALIIGRLYRLRYLHRGRHSPPSAIDLVRQLRLSLGRPVSHDSS